MAISRRDILKTAAGAMALAGSSNQGVEAANKIASQQSELNGLKWSPRKFRKKPNIVIAILDDIGFSDLGCFGSEIETSCIDQLAANGVRYNNFHVTALCAPTRACLMTGQNAHRVGVGNIAEWGRPLPGYRGYIREGVKMLPQMLKDEGYNTIAVGKWHMSMVNDQNAMGPFNHWPTGRGFDHWYGFHGSAVDHWHPELFRNQSQVYPDKKDGYHLTEDMADQSIAYIEDHLVSSPDQPFFLYVGFGACHFPHHAPASYIEKYHGRYDGGYETLRPSRLRKQKELGIAPEKTELSPRPKDIPAWDSLPEDERRFSARTHEAFAGMLTHADDQLKRVVDRLDELGQLGDTILIVMSDNGAGGGYHRAGVLDVRRVAYINAESIEEKMHGLDDVGTERSNNIYSTGWSFLGNTPLKRRKGDTYEGGTRSPFIVHWPNGNLPAGEICNQYHHAVDLVPTLLELVNAKSSSPEPLDGISLAYSFDHPKAATIKETQHYETAGDRAIWHKGWKAVTLHQKNDAFDDDVWALYHAKEDFSEIHNLAAKETNRLETLKALWGREAAANSVLPLDDDLDGLYAKVAPKPRPRYVFFPDRTRLNRLSAPDIYRYNFDVAAHVTLGTASANGVLLASGDSAAGYELFMKNGYLHFVYVFTREQITLLVSRSPVLTGKHVIGLRGRSTGVGSSAVDLIVDGQVVNSAVLSEMWKVEALNAGVRCGENRGAPISFRYVGSNKFDQKLSRVVVTLEL